MLMAKNIISSKYIDIWTCTKSMQFMGGESFTKGKLYILSGAKYFWLGFCVDSLKSYTRDMLNREQQIVQRAAKIYMVYFPKKQP